MPNKDPTGGPLCWARNKRGHVKRQWPQRRLQHGAGGQAAGGSSGSNDASMAKSNELIDITNQSKKDGNNTGNVNDLADIHVEVEHPGNRLGVFVSDA